MMPISNMCVYADDSGNITHAIERHTNSSPEQMCAGKIWMKLLAVGPIHSAIYRGLCSSLKCACETPRPGHLFKPVSSDISISWIMVFFVARLNRFSFESGRKFTKPLASSNAC
jgi:hypothetical protein